ncbi:basic salivary proline-rich protein 1-like isoform X41 [Ostrea edulis]|uniref:basic salivary proline-rich protein 1-like isoform X41 n=1 Tax=Ostrea edulis TaxID=37623 RepID=UPI0024AF6200|nr:basic salivary proline-rich protein 1-like isoform X41 [Ostrea edulis]
MSKTPLPDYSQLARWTVNDVCTWLMENRFGNFVSQFREHGIDGGRFANLKDVDLSQMRCPLNKRTELLKCIRNIPNRDITPPTLQRPVATFTSSRPPIPSRIEDRHPPPVPSTNDVDSGSDDDYEAWDEFDDFDSPDEDYINEQENQLLKKPNSRIPERHQQPPEPAIPPRPARPGKGGDRPPPQIPHSPLPPRGGRHGRGPAPLPEPEDQPSYIETDDPLLNQPDYEVPEEVSSPAPKLPKSRPPVKPPQVIDDQPTYEDPDETDNIPAPPPSRGGRRPPPKPAEPPPMPQDMPEDFYEDPDESNPVPAPVPDRSRAKMPPLPKTQKDPPSLNRTVSEPDIPAPPPPRAGQGKNKKRQPQPLPSEPQDSDDSSSSDYEKPESNRPPATSNSKPRQRAPPPAKPPEDDLPKAKHASREEKAQPPVPSSKTPHRGSQEENTFPPVPTSRTHQRTTQINEGRSLPPTPTDHKGIKPQGRGSVIDRRPPPVPGSEDDIFQHDWYQNVNRAEADEVLKNFGKNGTFLIRPSTKDGQPFTLQIYNNTKVYNLPIRQRTDSKFALGREKKAEETFKTVMDLVNFFKKHTLILAAGGDGQTRLKHSCPPI